MTTPLKNDVGKMHNYLVDNTLLKSDGEGLFLTRKDELNFDVAHGEAEIERFWNQRDKADGKDEMAFWGAIVTGEYAGRAYGVDWVKVDDNKRDQQHYVREYLPMQVPGKNGKCVTVVVKFEHDDHGDSDEEADGVPVCWNVSNKDLQAKTQGLQYRLKKSMRECDRHREKFAPWGSIVWGVGLGKKWVKVGDEFLPQRIQNYQVLLPMDTGSEMEEKIVMLQRELTDLKNRRILVSVTPPAGNSPPSTPSLCPDRPPYRPSVDSSAGPRYTAPVTHEGVRCPFCLRETDFGVLCSCCEGQRMHRWNSCCEVDYDLDRNGVDGVYSTDDGCCTIKGKVLVWAGGSTDEVDVDMYFESGRPVWKVQLRRTDSVGYLQDGQLRWSDGDVWTRIECPAPRSPVALHASAPSRPRPPGEDRQQDDTRASTTTYHPAPPSIVNRPRVISPARSPRIIISPSPKSSIYREVTTSPVRSYHAPRTPPSTSVQLRPQEPMQSASTTCSSVGSPGKPWTVEVSFAPDSIQPARHN